MNRLLGRVAVVTGSTSGIGFSIAKRLAEEGAKVIICSRKEENVQSAKEKLLKEGLEVKGMVCHVASFSDRRNLLLEADKWGGVDILINNVAVNPKAAVTPIYDCPENAWDKILEVNLKVPYLLSQEALPQLRRSPAGRIMYVSTIGVFLNQYTLGAYAISKTALLGLTKQGALHLARDNITVNCIAPGMIDTSFSKVLFETEEDSRKMFSYIPLDRLGSPDEISGTAAFLASDDASYITGETIVVAGGVHSRL